MVGKNTLRIPNNRNSNAIYANKSLFFSLFLTLITILSTINQWTLSHNFITYATISESLLKSPPSLYDSYWEIHPPFLFLLLAFWIWLFGNTLISFYALYAIVLLFFYLVINLLVSKLHYKLNVLVFQVILLSDFVLTNIFNMFFPIDIIGTLFCLTAILLLVIKCNLTNITLAFTLSLLAIFTKEVFIFMPLALFVFLAISKKIAIQRLLGAMAVSIVFVMSTIYLELKISNSLEEYLQVTKYKKDIFSNNIFAKLVEQIQLAPYLYIKNFTVLGFNKNLSKLVLVFCSLLVVVMVIAMFKQSSRKSYIDRIQNSKIALIYFGLISIMLGFLWQGKPLDDHYAIVVVPFVLIILYDGLNRIGFTTAPALKNRKIAKFFNVIVLLVLLIPNANQIELSANRIINNLMDIRKNFGNMESESELSSLTFKIPGCLQVAYGWGSARYYHYSKIDPCSKYFLAELTVMSKDLSENFRLDLLNNPPSAIYYNPLEADLDVKIYEKNVFPYKNVISYCYAKDMDNQTLYRAKYLESSKMKDCLSLAVK